MLGVGFDHDATPESPDESQAERYRRACNHPEDRDEANLCQQWRTADATVEATRLSARQVWIGGIGAILSVISAVATAWAALAAGRAAQSAQSSADTANAALDVMRETAERQLRAYVGVGSVVCRHLVGEAEFHVEFKNTGQTPAYGMTFTLGVRLTDNPPSSDTFVEDQIAVVNRAGVLGAGAFFTTHTIGPRQLTETELKQLGDGNKTIYIFGTVRYRDAFDRKRLTKYRHMVGGGVKLTSDGRMGIAPEGNEAE